MELGREEFKDLYLDNQHLDQNTDMLVNPNKAMLSKSEVSDDIKSIEVFSAGFFSLEKLSIMVNGVVVLQDKLSLLDRFAKSFFLKVIQNTHTTFLML